MNDLFENVREREKAKRERQREIDFLLVRDKKINLHEVVGPCNYLSFV